MKQWNKYTRQIHARKTRACDGPEREIERRGRGDERRDETRRKAEDCGRQKLRGDEGTKQGRGKLEKDES